LTLGQIIYCLAIAGLFAWRGSTYAAWVIALDQVAILAACLAMDLGALTDSGSLLTMMLIDVAAGVALISRPGLPRLLSIGYSLTVPLYALEVHDYLSRDTTFALVMAIGFVQIVVAGIGSSGGDYGHGNRGHSDGAGLLFPRRNRRGFVVGLAEDKGGLATGRDNVSQGRR
jgi:hypothetical protein